MSKEIPGDPAAPSRAHEQSPQEAVSALRVSPAIAREIGNINIRTASDPCTLRSWVIALFEPDYPTRKEAERAANRADEALARIARAAVALAQGIEALGGDALAAPSRSDESPVASGDAPEGAST